jgi:hypothetical protein
MAGADQASEHLKRYLQQLTPQVRSRLLTELERLHHLGEDVLHSEELIALLRAEFRNTGQSHYRAGNPSRHFFQLLEPMLVDSAPERANAGQIARGSLGPIWSVIAEKLLPSMTRDYAESAKKAIAANKLGEAQNFAAAFRKKVLIYLDGVLGSADGADGVRAELKAHTSSHAAFDDLMKMLRVIRAQQPLLEFAAALPPKIREFDGALFFKVLDLLNTLKAKDASGVPFALTITAGRLSKHWQLIHFATKPAGSQAVSKIAAMPYAIAVSMVLDGIDEKRQSLLDAFKTNRIPLAKEVLNEIYAIENAVRERIDLGKSDWGNRLHDLMTSVDVALDAEINTIPVDHRNLKHTLESSRLRPGHSWTERLSQIIKKGQATLAGS